MTLDIGMPLAAIIALYKLIGVSVNAEPVVSLLKDLICQDLSSKMTFLDTFMELAQGIISLYGSEATKKWHQIGLPK